jgi:diguanylate cyclase (GGDEF)-like protein
MIVAPETTLDGAMVLGERLRSTVEQTAILYDGSPIHVTVSIGFAVVEPGMPAEFEQLKYVASAAMNQAKAEGRNQCVVRSLSPAEADSELVLSRSG